MLFAMDSIALHHELSPVDTDCGLMRDDVNPDFKDNWYRSDASVVVCAATLPGRVRPVPMWAGSGNGIARMCLIRHPAARNLAGGNTSRGAV
jgi:hypothetical protein